MTNNKSTKRALLSSALSVVMCLAMLVGTTFAWFTDTASTAVNKIQAGNLDVALEMYENGEWVSAEGKTLNFVAKDGRTDILWEPGCSYETTSFRIVNKGNLALKYKIIISGINGDAKLNEAIEWKYGYQFANGSWAEYALENLTTSQTVLKNADTPLGDWEARAFKITGHMKETAGNEYQDLSIEGISITVIATQAQNEQDINGNTYDKDAIYDTEAIKAADLKAILTNNGAGGVVELTKNYVLTDAWTPLMMGTEGHDIPGNGTLTIKGNGHTIYGLTAPLVGATTYPLTIEGLTIANANVADDEKYSGVGVLVQYSDASEVTLTNCHVVNSNISTERDTRVGALVGWTSSQLNVTDCSVVNCDLSTFGSIGAVVGHASGATTIKNITVKDCDFASIDDGGWRVGVVIGTADTSAFTINGYTVANNTLTQKNKTTPAGENLYGRTVNGGTVTITK